MMHVVGDRGAEREAPRQASACATTPADSSSSSSSSSSGEPQVVVLDCGLCLEFLALSLTGESGPLEGTWGEVSDIN